MYATFSNVNTAQAVALTFDEAVAARAVEADGFTVVAVIVKDVWSRSQRTALKNGIQSAIADALSLPQDKVVVTFDVEVYRISDDAKPSEILALARNR